MRNCNGKIPRKKFVLNLVRLRRNAGHTQKSFSKLIGMPLSTYAHLEAGRIPYTILDYLESITHTLQVSYDELFDNLPSPPKNIYRHLDAILENTRAIKNYLHTVNHEKN